MTQCVPISGGSVPTCTGDSTFVFTVAQAGVIDSVAGTAARDVDVTARGPPDADSASWGGTTET